MSISTFCLAPPQTYRNSDSEFDEEDALFENTVQALSSVFFVWNHESEDIEFKSPSLDSDHGDADFACAFPAIANTPAAKTRNQSIHHTKKRLNSASSEDDDYDSENVSPEKVNLQNHRRGKRFEKEQTGKKVQGDVTPGLNAFTGLPSSPIGSQNLIAPKKIVKSKKNVHSRRSPRSRKISKNKATVKRNKVIAPL